MTKSSYRCHGCGSILSKSLLYYPINGKLHKAFCEDCSCWSWFDQQGFYKDPPLTEILNGMQSKPHSKNFKSISDNSFCEECSRNQTIVMQIMASYLPDETDSEYDHLLKNYNNYKKELETRYPLVCCKCAPFVQRKLLQVNKKLWSMVKANTDPKTITASKPKSSYFFVLVVVLALATCLFYDWIRLSKRVSDCIIICLIIILFASNRGEKGEKSYPPTSIKVHGASIGTQSDSRDSETNIESDHNFSLNELTLSKVHSNSKSSLFSGDVGEPVSVPWHVSSFQIGKTDVNLSQVRLDSNPQMINPKSWAKTAFMPNQQAKINNSNFNLGPDLITAETSRFELKKPTFVPPSVSFFYQFINRKLLDWKI